MLRVLLIEDNPFNQRIARSLLKDVARVDMVSTLAEGLERVGEGAYDVVLLDLLLPDSNDAEETVRRMADAVPPMPVIAYTAMGQVHGDIARWVDGVIKKPCDARTLIRTIRKAVLHRQNGHLSNHATTRLREAAEAMRLMVG